eukprot:TRINITY_DN4665_c0_g1_i1.p1 TRINITY_DN4665_c0_g1~~TRINITY_DN4665_c0_g1_i1.p1  ORF type:complete len:486 (+),score=140.09 TRINITY_DN4665_c0_g1_i1:37-1494(+)
MNKFVFSFCLITIFSLLKISFGHDLIDIFIDSKKIPVCSFIKGILKDNSFSKCDKVGEIPFDPMQRRKIDSKLNEDLIPIPVLGFPTIINPYFLERAVYSIDYPIKKLFIGWNGNYNNIKCAIFRIKENLGDLVEIKQYPENLGVSPMWNEIAMADENAEYFIISNDDVRFLPGSLKNVAEQMEKERDLLTKEIPALIYGCTAQSDKHPMWEAFIVSQTAFKLVGTFDENFYILYYEDDDYRIRSEMVGIVPERLESFKIHHGYEDRVDYISGTRFDHRGALPDELKERIERSPPLYHYLWQKVGRKYTYKSPFNLPGAGPGFWAWKWNRPYFIRSTMNRANRNYFELDLLYSVPMYKYGVFQKPNEETKTHNDIVIDNINNIFPLKKDQLQDILTDNSGELIFSDFESKNNGKQQKYSTKSNIESTESVENVIFDQEFEDIEEELNELYSEMNEILKINELIRKRSEELSEKIQKLFDHIQQIK